MLHATTSPWEETFVRNAIGGEQDNPYITPNQNQAFKNSQRQGTFVWNAIGGQQDNPYITPNQK